MDQHRPPQSPGFAQEPVFWTSTVPNYNDADRNVRYVRDGQVVHERVPQGGHLGSYDDKRPHPGRNWFRFLTHTGNVVALRPVNGAAHYDLNTGYAQMELARCNAQGWLHYGRCPISLVQSGEIAAGHIAAASILEDRPCPPNSHDETNPCPHMLAEDRARKERNAKVEREREAMYKSEEAKRLEEQSKTQNATLAALAEVLRRLDEKTEPREPEAKPEPEKPEHKKKP